MIERSEVNKKTCIQNVNKIIKEGNDEILENLFESLYKQLFELFREDDNDLKEESLKSLQELFSLRP